MDQPTTTRGFRQSPSLWVGGVLWVLVGLATVSLWTRRPNAFSAPPVAAEKGTDSSEPPRITITTDKDGTARVVLPGENPDSPWDKDGISDFSLIDTNKKKVTKADLLGKPWIVCFVFTHCALTCPTVTNSMRDLQDQLKDYDFRLVTMTVDPERDTPEVLKGYGETRGADFRKWMFLGGDQREIYRLIQGSFKMPVKELQGEKRKQGFEFIHSNNIMLVDEKGVVLGKFDATNGPQMAALRKELQKVSPKVDAKSK